jgi:hypothetical protein
MDMDNPSELKNSNINFGFTTTKKSPSKLALSPWSIDTPSEALTKQQLSKNGKKKLQKQQRAMVNAGTGIAVKKKNSTDKYAFVDLDRKSLLTFSAFTPVSDPFKLEGRARRFVDTTGEGDYYEALRMFLRFVFFFFPKTLISRLLID